MGDPANYSDPFLHATMVQDSIRCNAYKKAIAATVKPGMTVLDLGAGSGILSVFAAQAGASKVYAVEKSCIISLTKEVIKDNNFSSQIEIINEDVDKISLPEKVDVIVSEWMGGYAIDENMLGLVLTARDKFLKPDGYLLPSYFEVQLALVNDQKRINDYNYWRTNPYGVNLTAFDKKISELLHYGRNDIKADNVYSDILTTWQYDLYVMLIETANNKFQINHKFKICKTGQISALAVWFKVQFPNGDILTNAPDHADTHWGRTIFPFNEIYEIKENSIIDISFTCEPVDPGYCTGGWSMKMEDGTYEQHGKEYNIIKSSY